MANHVPALTPGQRAREVGNLLNLSTPLGCLVAAIGGASVRRGPRGLLLAEGYRPRFPVAAAFTVGNVVISRHPWDEMARRQPRLLRHEERHSSQYLWCAGLPYLPLYTACMAWSVLRCGDRASANFFERNAGLEAGGYLARPRRPLLGGAAAQLSRLRSMPRRFAERLR
jgi:hypothetical protein